jgi:hypothetical protein
MDLYFLGVIWQQLVLYSPYLVGVILPPFIEVLNKDVTDHNEQVIVTVLTCVLAATLLHWTELTTWSVDAFFGNLAIIIGESQVVYAMYWKNSVLKTKLNDSLTKEEVALPERATV